MNTPFVTFVGPWCKSKVFGQAFQYPVWRFFRDLKAWRFGPLVAGLLAGHPRSRPGSQSKLWYQLKKWSKSKNGAKYGFWKTLTVWVRNIVLISNPYPIYIQVLRRFLWNLHRIRLRFMSNLYQCFFLLELLFWRSKSDQGPSEISSFATGRWSAAGGSSWRVGSGIWLGVSVETNSTGRWLWDGMGMGRQFF